MAPDMVTLRRNIDIAGDYLSERAGRMNAERAVPLPSGVVHISQWFSIVISAYAATA
jgi:hypothetical protein